MVNWTCQLELSLAQVQQVSEVVLEERMTWEAFTARGFGSGQEERGTWEAFTAGALQWCWVQIELMDAEIVGLLYPILWVLPFKPAYCLDCSTHFFVVAAGRVLPVVYA